MENIYVKIDLKLGSNAAGKPTIDTSDCSTRISNVQVHFYGRFGYVTSPCRPRDAERPRLLWERGFQALVQGIGAGVAVVPWRRLLLPAGCLQGHGPGPLSRDSCLIQMCS